ncbi:Hhe domain protein [Favolaschia claudopus]|uniref:Hhe domain protein n=1 Tax=Favolaschia claudopus TaxID=2862362 RepID=A0AAV9Z708_9AGAR
MASKQTLTQAIKEDHQEMYEYHDNYKKFSGDADSQTRWANQLRWEIARHAVGEELVVYPLMEKHLGAQGRKLADHDREEHQHVKEMLYKMESMTPGSAEYDKLLERMMVSLREHNDSEEANDLPILETHLGEGSQQAASQFSLTKKFAPTRSHPSAPNKPPFETFAGFLAAPMDKLKDAFTKFPTNETKDAAAS